MIRLPRLFGGDPAPRPAPADGRAAREALLEQIAELERSLGPATEAVTRARAWNRVALAAADLREDPRAKQCFGRAIDAYIEAGYYDTAAALCRRFLVQYPDVVRAHCTLALLCVVRRDLGDAVQAIHSYARSARRANTDDLAVSRLRLVAERAADEDVRQAAIQAVGDLGDAQAQQDLRTALSATMPPLSDADGLNDLVAVALLNEMEVRARARTAGIDPLPPDLEGAGVVPVRTRFPQPMDFEDSDSYWLG